MRNARLSLLALVFGAPLCFAEASNYSYVQVGYNSFSLEVPGASDIDFDGFDIEASYQFSNEWYAAVAYYDVESEDPIDVGGFLVDAGIDLLTVSAGFIFAQNDAGSLYGEIGFADAGVSASLAGASASESESGFTGALGFRANMGERMEARLGANFIDVDVFDDTFVSADLVYHFFPNLGALESLSGVISFTTSSDTDAFVLGVRGSF